MMADPARVARAAILLLALALGACAAGGPTFGSAAATIPPLPPGEARIFFYRWLEPYETLTPTTAYLNGNPVGVTEPGAVLYRDVPPGKYLVSVFSEGIYPNQFKTIELRAGEVAYARVESLSSWVPCGTGGGKLGAATEGCDSTFVVQFIDPVEATYEMNGLRLIAGQSKGIGDSGWASLNGEISIHKKARRPREASGRV